MHKNSLYYSNTRLIKPKVTLDLFNFCIAFAFILLIMIVILRITTIFAVYYSNTRNKYNILIRNNYGNNI